MNRFYILIFPVFVLCYASFARGMEKWKPVQTKGLLTFNKESERLKAESKRVEAESKRVEEDEMRWFLFQSARPLLENARKGCLKRVKGLVEKNDADVNWPNMNGQTPLWLACEEGHLEVVKYLAGVCHARVNVPDWYRGMTEMEIAHSKGNTEVVKYLDKIAERLALGQAHLKSFHLNNANS